MTERTMQQLKKMGITPSQVGYTEGKYPSFVKKTFIGFKTVNGNRFTKKYEYRICFKDMDCFGKGKYVDYYYNN